jgi:predicted nucleotide-binding protein
MTMPAMASRFEGAEGARRLLDAVTGQHIVQFDPGIAARLIAEGSLVQFAVGETLIEQGGTDNDVFFVLVGEADVFVNARYVATRGPGECVGEMAALDPTAARAATLRARSPLTALKVPEPAVCRLLEDHPKVAVAILRKVAERLRQRAAYHSPPNPRPVVFIGSSAEGLLVAREIQTGLSHDPFDVVIWTDGVFGPSRVPIESLMAQVDAADFAVLVLGPDDDVKFRGAAVEAPRDNVIFELGLFMGRIDRARTFMVRARGIDLRIPTDLIGVTPLEYDIPPAKDYSSTVGPVCHALRKAIQILGTR